MVTPQKLPSTQGDYRALPSPDYRYQLVEGDLITTPTPNRYHQEISGNLTLILCAYLKDHPIGEMYHALDVYLDEFNVLRPDVLFVSEARFSIFTEEGADGAPDLAIEILSPSTADLDREKKRKIYARHGVTEFWIVSPESRTVQIYRLQEDAGKPVAIRGEHETVETPLLPGLKVKLSEVFAE